MTMPSDARPGPNDIIRRELSNGIVILVRENPNTQAVVIAGSLNAGSLFDPPDLLGLSGFMTSVLMRGTTTREFAAIHELLEGNGASLSISGGMHTIGFGGKGLVEDLPMLVDLLGDALRFPSFEERQVERLRGEMITALKIQQQDTRYMAALAFRELAYPPGHPYRLPVEGRVETITHIQRDALIEFHRQHVGPGGMLIVVVGAIKADQVIRLIEEKLGDWQNPAQPVLPALPDAPPMETVRASTVIVPGKSQADVVLGFPGPSRLASDWHAANLANSILGVFGMYGRIGAEVREKQGMAYYSFSRLDGGLGPGAWRIVAGVDPANIERTIAAIRHEIDRMTSEWVTEEELADTKANFVGRLPLQLENNEGVAGAILMMERYGLGLNYLREYESVINAITAREVLAAAQHYLNADAYAVAVAGPDGIPDVV